MNRKHPRAPVLYESYGRDARRSTELAEEANGPLSKPVDPACILEDALALQTLGRVDIWQAGAGLTDSNTKSKGREWHRSAGSIHLQ